MSATEKTEKKAPLLPVARAVQRATRLRPSRSTVWRWVGRGSHGVKLETVMVGGRRFATVAMVEKFLCDVTAASGGALTFRPEAKRKGKQRLPTNKFGL